MTSATTKLLAFAVAVILATLGGPVWAQTQNTNTTIQVGQVNINRTYQCGDSNDNVTYQSGRININHTIQRCGNNGNRMGQLGGINRNKTDQGILKRIAYKKRDGSKQHGSKRHMNDGGDD